MRDKMESRDILAQQLQITGLIQGVGFRPFIYRLANKNKLSGNIKNCGSHVDILAQGHRADLAKFLDGIHQHNLPLANINSIRHKNIAINSEIKEFTIEQSSNHKNIQISHVKDYALCDVCLAEFNDPGNRRFCYAFISCTNCGPRYSILRNFPLDRKNTSFSKFTPCLQCMDEYKDPGNRRFHAQNISCSACGPQLRLNMQSYTRLMEEGIIQDCVTQLLLGEIVCIKGVSGYRLYGDAMNETAVAKLRDLKHRPDKPFAVIYPYNGDLTLLKTDLLLDDESSVFLQQATRAIVLIQQTQTSSLARNIAPGLTTMGVMLPATGLEHLLLNKVNRPLVATSANLSGDNIMTDAHVAEEQLSQICPIFIHHNLDIQHGLDDSVFKSNPSHNIVPIRLARAYAPHEYKLPFVLDEPILAFGAQTKNTITLAWKNRAVSSQHLGDMHKFEVWKKSLIQVDVLQKMFSIEVKRYLVDANPAYTANQWVNNNKLIYSEILHHHAHASALFFEHCCMASLLVFTWDGTGYGDNGVLWGGEAFYGSPGDWSHVSSVRPFKLPGGINAIKEPWRVAASLCWHVDQEYAGRQANLENLKQLWQSNANCPLTSSVGRLFDAAAVFLGLSDIISYDAQAAMYLEAVATCDTADFVKLAIKNAEFDWQPLLGLLQDLSLTVSYRAKVFHNSLAHVILDQTVLLSEKHAFDGVGLTGGVFQNSLLTTLAKDLLSQQGYVVLLNETLPTNDAAISLGQVMEYGMRKGRLN